ncbi:MAG: metallophosphoesterase family protein [Vicinamibacterales bacterium]
MLVGLIADTHGLMRDEALRALRGSDVIIHAGDVGRRSVLEALAAIAPVRAVYGNVDLPDATLVASIDCELEGVRVHVSHGHELGAPTAAKLAARYPADVIVYGHTHRAAIERVHTRLVVNPGAAGPARFNSRPSVALLSLPWRDARIVWL